MKVSESTGCCVAAYQLGCWPPDHSRKHQQAHECQIWTTGQWKKVGWSDDGSSCDFGQRIGEEKDIWWVLLMLGQLGWGMLCALSIPLLKKKDFLEIDVYVESDPPIFLLIYSFTYAMYLLQQSIIDLDLLLTTFLTRELKINSSNFLV